MDKFIFLDIDGVLNTANYQSWRQFWGREISDNVGHLFAPSAVRNLERIIKYTGAKIVLSSSWRLDGLEMIREMWTNRKMPGEIYDVTPYVNAREYPIATRGVEIQKWMQDNHCIKSPFVVIDDVDDFLDEQQKNVIMTNYRRGLTLIKALKAIMILNHKPVI